MSAWTEEEHELVTFAEETAKEWWDLRVVDDKQYIALLKLLHELHNKVYMEYRREENG